MISLLGIIFIYLSSRWLIHRASYILHRHIGSRSLVIGIISFICFPGTVIHEVSHLFAALILNLRVESISVFPTVRNGKIYQGEVLYYRNPEDFLRPIIVGIAPVIGALFSLWVILQTGYLFNHGYYWTAVLGYLILSITANMFSSDTDLQHVWPIIPLIGMAVIVQTFFPIQIPQGIVFTLVGGMTQFLYSVQPAILFSAAGHAILVVLMLLVRM